MGATSRAKGQTGEREIAALIRDLTDWDVRRRVRQHDGDSDLLGVPGWTIEVKRHAQALRGDVAGWWRQAVEQAGAGDRPVLFFRQDRDQWRAVWPLGVHLGTNWPQYEMTVEGSVEAWAAVAREPQDSAICELSKQPDRPMTSTDAEVNAVMEQLADVLRAFRATRKQIRGRPVVDHQALAQADALIAEWQPIADVHKQSAVLKLLPPDEAAWLVEFSRLVDATICSPRETA